MKSTAADKQTTEGTTAHPASTKKQPQHLQTHGAANLPQSTGYGPRWGAYPISRVSKAIYF